jgi:hypothetical protein
MLDARFLIIQQSNKLFDYKNLRSYEITRIIDNIAYELDLPILINVFSVFHF